MGEKKKKKKYGNREESLASVVSRLRKHKYGLKIPQRKQTNCGIWNGLLQSIGNHSQCIIYDEKMKISTFLIGIDICEI